MTTQTTERRVGVAVGVAAAAAAAAAGAYWLYGSKDAAKHRRMVHSWMLKARAEVMEAVEELQQLDKDTYMTIVDTVLKRYAGLKGVTSSELAQMTRDLKGAWDHINRARESDTRAVRSGTRAARKATRKTKSRK